MYIYLKDNVLWCFPACWNQEAETRVSRGEAVGFKTTSVLGEDQENRTPRWSQKQKKNRGKKRFEDKVVTPSSFTQKQIEDKNNMLRILPWIIVMWNLSLWAL